MPRLQVLGTIDLTEDDGASLDAVLTRHRPLALLVYLVLAEPTGVHRRDKLCALLWPELGDTQARHALRQALHSLRGGLGDVFLTRGDAEIGVAAARLTCDAVEFLAALDASAPVEALAHYGGELLDGFHVPEAQEFEYWLEGRRADLKQRAVEAALTLARACAAENDVGEAKRWTTWAGARAPYDETVLRRSMAIMDLLGDRGGAVLLYQRFEERLRRELEIAPSPESRALVDRLREPSPPTPAKRPAPSTGDVPAIASPDTAPPALSDEHGPKRAARPRWSRIALAALGTAIAVVALAIALGRGSGGPGTVPQPTQVTFAGTVVEASLSRDGRFVAYVTDPDGGQRLYVREIGGGAPIELLRSEFVCCAAWSPDGARLAYRTYESTFIRPRFGDATPRQVTALNIGRWSPDGTTIYSWWPQTRRLVFTDVVSGDTTSIPLPFGHEWLEGAHWSRAAGRLALVSGVREEHTVWTMRTDGTDPQAVMTDSTILLSPLWSSDGRSLFVGRLPSRERPLDVLRVEIDDQGRAAGAPVVVLSRLDAHVRNPSLPAFSISEDGRRLLYTRRFAYANVWLFDLSGDSAVATQLTTGTARRRTPRLSPDRRRLLYTEATGEQSSLYLRSLAGGDAEQLTFGGLVWSPTWSPTGDRVAVGTLRRRSAIIRTIDVRAGAVRDIAGVELADQNHLTWLTDSTVGYVGPEDRTFRVTEGAASAERTVTMDDALGWLYQPRVSPDGRYVAFHHTRPTPARTTMRVWSLADGRVVADAEGMAPVGWSDDGAAVYVMAGAETPSTEIYALPLGGGPARPVFALPSPALPWDVDVLGDGSRIVAALGEHRTDAWVLDNFDRR